MAEVPAGGLSWWTVVVNDPEQTRAHTMRVLAPSEAEARLRGYKRAVLADPNGAYRMEDEGTSWAERVSQVRDPDLMDACVPYATATEEA